MKTIAFDVMGNDNGLRPSIEACKIFINKNPHYKIILVGDKNKINKFLMNHDRISIMNTKEVATKNTNILDARNGESSMAIAIRLVANKKADLVISSGYSSIYLALCTIILKRIKGVKRSAFMPIFPTIIPNKKFVMLDVGANLISTTEMLVQWSILANIFSKKILKVKSPKIGIINIGTEKNKGHDFHQETYKILSKNKNINFYKFIEPRELLKGIVDVAVVDGYAGNMILKAMEGASLSILKLLKTNITSKFIYKIGAWISKGAFIKTKETLDYRNVGAAWVLGINGLALKSHGGADKKSYLGAFNQAMIALENNILHEFQGAIHG